MNEVIKMENVDFISTILPIYLFSTLHYVVQIHLFDWRFIIGTCLWIKNYLNSKIVPGNRYRTYVTFQNGYHLITYASKWGYVYRSQRKQPKRTIMHEFSLEEMKVYRDLHVNNLKWNQTYNSKLSKVQCAMYMTHLNGSKSLKLTQKLLSKREESCTFMLISHERLDQGWKLQVFEPSETLHAVGPPTDNLAASFTHTREYDEYTKLLRGPTSLNEIPFDIP